MELVKKQIIRNTLILTLPNSQEIQPHKMEVLFI